MNGHRTALAAGLVLALFAASCSDDGVQPGPVVEGTWGAEHVGLVADAAGFQVEYDCAHGAASRPLALAADGTFAVAGTYTREGGPIDVNSPWPELAAEYHGRLVGGQLLLTVTLTEEGTDIGPYWLTRGATVSLNKCY